MRLSERLLSLKGRYKQFIFERFIAKKHRSNPLTFKHNNTYVLPSKLGFGFLLVALLNFVMGINYQNNLILLMAYLMVMVLVFALLRGYKNLKGVTVEYIDSTPSFAPNPPTIFCKITAPSDCHDFTIHYDSKSVNHSHLQAKEDVTLSLPLPLKLRGKHPLKRIKFISQFPFGLVSIWSYLEVNQDVYVYPNNQFDSDSASYSSVVNEEDGQHKQLGIDDFHQLNQHQENMGIKRISWKHYAKTQQLLVKEFTSATGTKLELNFANLSGTTEERLAILSTLVCELTQQQREFSLKLESQYFTPSSSEAHKIACLQALAEF